MQKLLNYLKQGNGRGLKAMLIFSVLATLLSWGMNYNRLEQIPSMTPNFPILNTLWLHVGFVLAALTGVWFLYLLVVGISALLALIFKLKLTKGTICRSTTVTLIVLFLISLLFSIIGYVLSLFGEIAILFYPIIIMILTPVLLVMLIAFGTADKKEDKKKK